jgi:hypothetical protein
MLLPEDGLDETFSWLKNAWQFYAPQRTKTESLGLALHPNVRGESRQAMARAPLVMSEE